MAHKQPKLSAQDKIIIEQIRRERARLCNPQHLAYDLLTLARIGAQMRAKAARKETAA